jgi:hypothetical protein
MNDLRLLGISVEMRRRKNSISRGKALRDLWGILMPHIKMTFQGPKIF